VLMLAVRYAAQHPAPGATGDEALYGDQPLELAGDGAPGMSEFAVAEFGAAMGMTPDAARRYLAKAIEVGHRLPEMWRLVQKDAIPAWRALMVAERTIHLSQAGALYVDAKVAARAGTVGPVVLVRLVDEAAFLTGEPAEDIQFKHRVLVDTRSMAVHGIGFVDAVMDAPDVLDLEKALQVAAAEIKADGHDLTLDERRSLALGIIARSYLGQHGEAPGGVQLYVHYSPDSDLGRQNRVRLENTHGLTTLDHVSEWLTHRPGATVKVTPVIDLPDLPPEVEQDRASQVLTIRRE
jgi:hypothetical protein